MKKYRDMPGSCAVSVCPVSGQNGYFCTQTPLLQRKQGCLWWLVETVAGSTTPDLFPSRAFAGESRKNTLLLSRRPKTIEGHSRMMKTTKARFFVSDKNTKCAGIKWLFLEKIEFIAQDV